MVKIWHVSYNNIFINIVIFFLIVYVLILKYIARGLLMLDRILSMMAVTVKIEFSGNIYILINTLFLFLFIEIVIISWTIYK